MTIAAALLNIMVGVYLYEDQGINGLVVADIVVGAAVAAFFVAAAIYKFIAGRRHSSE